MATKNRTEKNDSATVPTEIGKPASKRGLKDQLARLNEKVGVAGQAQAVEILSHFPHDVIRLAYRSIPDPAVVLGKREQAVLDLIPDEAVRNATRSAMLAAKVAKAVAVE